MAEESTRHGWGKGDACWPLLCLGEVGFSISGESASDGDIPSCLSAILPARSESGVTADSGSLTSSRFPVVSYTLHIRVPASRPWTAVPKGFHLTNDIGGMELGWRHDTTDTGQLSFGRRYGRQRAGNALVRSFSAAVAPMHTNRAGARTDADGTDENSWGQGHGH